MAVIGDLVTRLGVDGRKFQSGLDRARGDARSFAADVTKIVSSIAIYDIAKTGVLGIKDMLVGTVKLAASAEVMRSEFAVLLGDVGKSAKFFDQLEKFAARTSFSLESAGDSARQLMAAGVAENSLLDTMQLLGDLSLGDANRLQFLSKAYTDVFNNGRLQGQEIKQFAENGVGIVAALAGTLGKTAGEILQMSEAGEISFDMMQQALRSLTAEGGRFYGAMAGRNSTLMGQWDSLLEGIQKTGRAIGDSMLPQIKEVVVQANAMLGKFNELPDKIGFIGDVLTATFDVATEGIRVKWDDMLFDLMAATKDFAKDAAWNLISPFDGAAAAGAAGMNAGAKAGNSENLDAAMQRLEGLINQVRPDAKGPAEKAGPQAKPAFEGDSPAIKNLNAVYEEWDRLSKEKTKALNAFLNAVTEEEKTATAKALNDAQNALTKMADETVPAAHKAAKKESGGKKLAEGVSSLWESLQAPIAEAQMAAQGVWDRTKIKAGAAMGTLENIFTGEKKAPEKKIEPRLAGAMQAGSQEAYSTIVQAMIRQADPVVKATKEQTRELKRTLRETRPQRMTLVTSFAEV